MTNPVNYNSDINNLTFHQSIITVVAGPYNPDMLPLALLPVLWWPRRWALSINIGDLAGMIFNNTRAIPGITGAIWIMIVYQGVSLISLVGFIPQVKMTDKKTMRLIKNIPFYPIKTIQNNRRHGIFYQRWKNKLGYWFFFIRVICKILIFHKQIVTFLWI